MEVPFIGPSYTLDALGIDAQRCVNMYGEADESGVGKSAVALRRRPGLKLLATQGGTGANRGLYKAANGRFYSVQGSRLSEFDSSWTETVRGTLNTTVGIVSISENVNELVIVDGTNGYTLLFATNTFATISDVDFPSGATTCAFIDQYILANRAGTQFWNFSALNDATSWNGLDKPSAEGAPDNLVAVFVEDRRIWLFGDSTYEIWYDSGVGNIPFVRIEGTLKDIGCEAVNSIASVDGHVFWLGGNTQGYGQIYMSEGLEARRVSNHAIERDIQTYGDISDAIGITYQEAGHKYYEITFQTGNKTWVYDMSTGWWFQKTYLDPSDGSINRHRMMNHAFFDNKNIVGDNSNGNIYHYDSFTYDDNGDPIQCIRTSPHYWNNLDRLFINSFEIDLERGNGLTTGQGSDPQIMLKNSNDGGKTYGGEQWRSTGKQGEYKKRVKWNRQGMARDRVIEVMTSDPNVLAWIGFHVEMEQ
jgi:hypothetical protein